MLIEPHNVTDFQTDVIQLSLLTLVNRISTGANAIDQWVKVVYHLNDVTNSKGSN
jgi:hypothetical protein